MTSLISYSDVEKKLKFVLTILGVVLNVLQVSTVALTHICQI